MLLLPPSNRDRIYGEEHISTLNQLLDLEDCCDLVGDFDALKNLLTKTEIICSGWGMMKLDEAFLDAAPNLEAVFYGAGSVRGFVTDAFWDRDILLTSSWAANAVPVAQTTVALITLGLKKAFLASRKTCREKSFQRPSDIPGLYRAKVGIIGAGMIGSKVLERLKRYDVDCYAYDPYRSDKELRKLDAKPLELEEMFKLCDVVTLHAPNIESTQGMITGQHFASMKDGAVFINTARGALIRHEEMVEELKKGRIFACLDVTWPEPPESNSPLYELDNVFLTPHIAGAMGDECKRMGAYVIEEVRRYLENEPSAYSVQKEMMEWMA